MYARGSPRVYAARADLTLARKYSRTKKERKRERERERENEKGRDSAFSQLRAKSRLYCRGRADRWNQRPSQIIACLIKNSACWGSAISSTWMDGRHAEEAFSHGIFGVSTVPPSNYALRAFVSIRLIMRLPFVLVNYKY